MFYFEMKDCVNEEVIAIFSSEIKLKKGTVAVVPDGYDIVVTAVVERQVKTIEALSTGYEIEPIICTADITDLKARNLAKIKKAQLMKVMREEMEIIKTRETLEKFAGKDNKFRDLLQEYDELQNPTIDNEDNGKGEESE